MYWKMADVNLDISRKLFIKVWLNHILTNNYGILIWASALNKNVINNVETGHVPFILKSIKKAQNKIVRAIFRLPKYDKRKQAYTETSKLYKKLGILKFHDLYLYNFGVLCYEYFTKPDFPVKTGQCFKTRNS